MAGLIGKETIMPDPSEQGSLEVQAFIHRIRPFVVFFAPVGQIAEQSSGAVGTGFLVQFRGHKYFVSALHNFFYEESGQPGVIRSWEASRFKFPDPQPVNFEDARTFSFEQVRLDMGGTLPHSFPAGLFIDEEHDLIAVEVDGSLEQFSTAQFLDLERDAHTAELNNGKSLLTLGNPFAGRVPIPGDTARSALIPHMDHVLFDANLDTSGIRTDNLPPDHFFMPYSLHQEQIHPGGFSGAPIFGQGGSDKEPVWSVAPQVVGVVVSYFPQSHIIVAVKIQAAIQLLEKAHG
jgi:hypothetical protein